ncbi:MAG: type II toxin-antitoxin system RelE/ParE family toxin [Sedimenticola sp.]
MESYKIVFKNSVVEDLLDLPSREIKWILGRIGSLAEKARAEGCIRISEQERYRVRQGVYRIVYEIKDSEFIVIVIKVAGRVRTVEALDKADFS